MSLGGLKKAMRKISGDRIACDSAASTDDADLVKKNGGAEGQVLQNNAQKSISEGLEQSGDVQRVCNACRELPEEVKGELNWLGCHFCPRWYCFPCADFTKKGDITALKRSDILWACPGCREGINEVGIQAFLLRGAGDLQKAAKDNEILDKLTRIESEMAAYKSDLKVANSTLMAGIESSINETLQQTIPVTLEKCLETAQSDSIKHTLKEEFEEFKNSVSQTVGSSIDSNVAKAWSSTLFGEEEFPAPDSEEWSTVLKKGKHKVLPRVIKKAVTDSNRDMSEFEKRKNNVIIYKAPEENKDNAARTQTDKVLVDELLNQIGVTAKPVSVSRLGQFDPEKVGEISRPIKIVFENSEQKSEVITNARKLKDAPEKYKNLSLSYDMSREQREESKNLAAQAKELSKNSTQYIWKVRGLPGQMELKRFNKSQ